MNKKNSNWIPEILYEEDSQLPFIEVPKGVPDPAMLFIFINRKTGETEMGTNGEELPIFEMDLRQFVDTKILKERLTEAEFDRVREVLGLQPLKMAEKKGSEITAKVKNNLTKG